MNLTICKTLCNECPFTKSAPKGWLGPHTLEDVLSTQQRGELFSCHMLRKEDMSRKDIESGAVRICRGFIASATKSGIAFGQVSETEKGLRELQILVADEDREDPDTILSSEEFEEHHGRAMPYRDIPKQIFYQRLGYKS